MYDGGPWHRTVYGSKRAVESHAKGRRKTNPDARIRVVRVSHAEALERGGYFGGERGQG